MIDLIKNNPYRVLGLFANATPTEITRQVESALQGIDISSPLDIVFGMSAPARQQEDILEAETQIENDKLGKYKRFWLFKDGCSQATERLISKDYDAAIQSWFVHNTRESTQNILIAYLAIGDLASAAVTACGLYTKTRLGGTDFFGLGKTPEELSLIFLEDLKQTSDKNAETELTNSGLSWSEYVDKTIIDKSINRIRASIRTAKGRVSVETSKAYQSALYNLFTASNYLRTMRTLYGFSLPEFQSLVKELTEFGTECLAAYYRLEDAEDKYKEISLYINYLSTNSFDEKIKTYLHERRQDELQLRKKEISLDVADACGEIEYNVLSFLESPSQTPTAARVLIEQSAASVVKLKDNIGYLHPTYIRVCGSLVKTALEAVGASINDSIDEQTVADGGSVICLIDEIMFKSNAPGEIYDMRNKYMNQLWALGLGPVDNPRFPNASNKMRYNRDILLSEVQFFNNNCNTIQGCEKYLELFPKGEHADTVRSRIQQLKSAQPTEPITPVIKPEAVKPSTKPTQYSAATQPHKHEQKESSVDEIDASQTSADHSMTVGLSITCIALLVPFIIGLLSNRVDAMCVYLIGGGLLLLGCLFSSSHKQTRIVLLFMSLIVLALAIIGLL